MGAAVVTGDIRKRVPPDEKWAFEIPCSQLESAARNVGPGEMLDALDLSKRTPLRNWRGLKSICEGQYDDLRSLMRYEFKRGTSLRSSQRLGPKIPPAPRGFAPASCSFAARLQEGPISLLPRVLRCMRKRETELTVRKSRPRRPITRTTSHAAGSGTEPISLHSRARRSTIPIAERRGAVRCRGPLLRGGNHHGHAHFAEPQPTQRRSRRRD